MGRVNVRKQTNSEHLNCRAISYMEIGMPYPTRDVKFPSIQRQSYHPIKTLSSRGKELCRR